MAAAVNDRENEKHFKLIDRAISKMVDAVHWHFRNDYIFCLDRDYIKQWRSMLKSRRLNRLELMMTDPAAIKFRNELHDGHREIEIAARFFLKVRHTRIPIKPALILYGLIIRYQYDTDSLEYIKEQLKSEYWRKWMRENEFSNGVYSDVIPLPDNCGDRTWQSRYLQTLWRNMKHEDVSHSEVLEIANIFAFSDAEADILMCLGSHSNHPLSVKDFVNFRKKGERPEFVMLPIIQSGFDNYYADYLSKLA